MTTAVQSATSRDAILAALDTSRAKTGESDTDMQNRFLKLLTTQLRNQDPLNPMDNAQMTSQMAQISTVDGIERLNKTLQVLMSNSTDTQAMQAAMLVGHAVLVAGRGMQVRDGAGIGGFELTGPADRVTATIRDAQGLEMRTLDLGARGEGVHTFQWDGKTDGGTAVADGAYTVELKAIRGADKVGASPLELSVVTGVVRSSTGVSLELGGRGQMKLDDVKQII